MDMDTVRDLHRHMEWADAAVWASVLASPRGRTDSRLLGLLHHLHVVQRAFLHVWRNAPDPASYPTLGDAPSLMLWARDYYPEALAYLQEIDDVNASRLISVPWEETMGERFGRAPAGTSLGETALQVALHSTYHRGQVNARLREVGGEPPLVDYIAWIWLGRPAAHWADTT